MLHNATYNNIIILAQIIYASQVWPAGVEGQYSKWAKTQYYYAAYRWGIVSAKNSIIFDVEKQRFICLKIEMFSCFRFLVVYDLVYFLTIVTYKSLNMFLFEGSRCRYDQGLYKGVGVRRTHGLVPDFQGARRSCEFWLQYRYYIRTFFQN